MKGSRRIWPEIFFFFKKVQVTVGNMKKSHKNGGYKKNHQIFNAPSLQE